MDLIRIRWKNSWVYNLQDTLQGKGSTLAVLVDSINTEGSCGDLALEKPLYEPEILILGGGPAGLTAAIYAARARRSVMLLETLVVGGQMRDTQTIENYPGFASITGDELAGHMAEQAKGLGAQILSFSPIRAASLTDDLKVVETKKAIYKPKALIIATGASPKRLPLPSEELFYGKGIHYCVTCDGVLYENNVIGVVGGGDSALDAALFLTNFASKVIIVRRHNYFKGAASTLEEVTNHPKIEVMYNWDMIDVAGDDMVTSALIKNTITGEEKSIDLAAVFPYIGTKPKVDLFKADLALNAFDYILTDEKLESNVKGVFVAGDVREKDVRQITTAVGDGTIAALNADRYLKQREAAATK